MLQDAAVLTGSITIKRCTQTQPSGCIWVHRVIVSIKAATSVNSEMHAFYWSLGRDIVEMKAESQWDSRFYDRLSQDLQKNHLSCAAD